MRYKWSSFVFENIKISSIDARAKSSWSSNTINTNSSKIPGAFASSNGIRLK